MNMQTIKQWGDIVEEDENIERLNTAIDAGFVEVRKKNKKVKDEEVKEEEVKKVVKVDDPKEVKFECTKMCYSFMNDTVCKNDKCTYAHAITDLKLRECNFGDRCLNIMINGDHYYWNNHKATKVCSFIHPCETLENYEDRVIKENKRKNLVKIKKDFKQVPEQFPVLKTKNQAKDIPVLTATPTLFRHVAVAPTVTPTTSVLQTNKDDKITVTIPEGMAIGVLEFLIKSGRTNVEIITK